ncbi:hypothetical protein ACFFLS_08995 [Flavobacterium procerum]|uniref:Lipoprotein n=1 Tax=Flavobacterium procerum TaxID=1455569 RepID=A0ABV6BRB6_9FLAO
MKNLLYLIIAITLFSCNEKSKSLVKVKTEIKKENKYSELLEKFENISFDTLKIFSEENFKKFKGRELDSLNVILFPKEITIQHFNDPPGLFACYKFSINKETIGLIMRTPSEYLPSSIKLFIYDSKNNKIKSYMELAESWGDAGDGMQKTSWLIKKVNKFEVFTWVNESSYENPEDSIPESWDSYFLIDISKSKFDTISNDTNVLAKKYRSLIKSNH